MVAMVAGRLVGSRASLLYQGSFCWGQVDLVKVGRSDYIQMGPYSKETRQPEPRWDGEGCPSLHQEAPLEASHPPPGPAQEYCCHVPVLAGWVLLCRVVLCLHSFP